MGRTRRVAIDMDDSWLFHMNFDSEGIALPPEDDFVVLSQEPEYFGGLIPIYYSRSAFYSDITVWGSGLISFGPPTDDQRAFMASAGATSTPDDFPGNYIVAGFPGTSDTIEIGIKANQIVVLWDFAEKVVITPGTIAVTGVSPDAFSGFNISGFRHLTTAQGEQIYNLYDAFVIEGDDGDNIITGLAAPETLRGLGGNDTLDGGGGPDRLEGGAGNDIYHVDNVGDNVIETDTAVSSDIIYSSVGYNLSGRLVETLTLTGSANINAGGNSLANTLNGNSGRNELSAAGGNDILNGLADNDALYGGDGNDILDGGTGIDLLSGGAGDDIIYVDNEADNVVEGAGGGNDTVYSSTSYNLVGRHVETLTLTGSGHIDATGNSLVDRLNGNDGNNALYGNGGNDTLAGFAGNDILNGGTGADTMSGGAGNDIYHVDNVGDNVIETDTAVSSDIIYSAVTYNLSGRHVETLALTGTASIAATGNSLANTLAGNSGANGLSGEGGNDILRGGLGNDTMRGGVGQDSFQFDTALGANNIDRIHDFTVIDDTIWLDDAIFTGLGLGTLTAEAFTVGAAATQADDRIIYDVGNGALLFDADGSGAGAAVQFAVVAAGLGMTASDFWIL